MSNSWLWSTIFHSRKSRAHLCLWWNIVRWLKLFEIFSFQASLFWQRLLTLTISWRRWSRGHMSTVSTRAGLGQRGTGRADHVVLARHGEVFHAGIIIDIVTSTIKWSSIHMLRSIVDIASYNQRWKLNLSTSGSWSYSALRNALQFSLLWLPTKYRVGLF